MKNLGKVEVSKEIKDAQGKWVTCNQCREMVYRKQVETNNGKCYKCDYQILPRVK